MAQSSIKVQKNEIAEMIKKLLKVCSLEIGSSFPHVGSET